MTLMLGKIEGRRRTGWQRVRCLNDTTDSMAMSLSQLFISGGQNIRVSPSASVLPIIFRTDFL